MASLLTASQREAKKMAVLEFLDAAARNNQPCPTLDTLGRLTRTSSTKIGSLIDELRKDGHIRYWIKTAPWIGQYRLVEIAATGMRTAKPERRKVPPPGAANSPHLDIDYRKQADARDLDLYGAMLPDVRFLRHRGWVITREKTGFRVGNAIVDATEIVAKAARERRLMGAAQ